MGQDYPSMIPSQERTVQGKKLKWQCIFKYDAYI